MSAIQLTDYQRHQLALINEFFEVNHQILSKKLVFSELVNESHAIAVMESSIPQNSSFDFHLDLIFTPGGLTNYYKSMTGGNNVILEAARKVFPDSPQITESIESFKTYMRSLLNESGIALAEPTAAMTGSVEKAFSGGEYEAKSGGGFWGTLKSLWNALTEGGSWWGIIHLILDIIGIVGDFIIPGVGVAADVLNAVIYLCRGEYLLAAISIIAAIVVGGGDALKLGKGVAKQASPVFVSLVKGSTTDAAQAVAKMAPKTGSKVLGFLGKIAGYIGGAMAKAISIAGSFFSGMAKVTSYIPGLNMLLKPIFDAIGSTLTKFGTRMTAFCDNLKILNKTVTKEALKKLEKGMAKGETFKLSNDGKVLYAYNSAGKKVGSLPAESLQKSDFVKIRYGSDPSNLKLFTNAAEFSKYQRGVSRIGSNKKFGSRFGAYFKNTLPRATKNLSAGLPFFIGKQIYKLVTGKEWKMGEGWSEAEVKGHGNAALNSWINDRIAKEKKESGAVYIPAVMLDSRDQEVMDNITAYQNNYAKMLNQPSIMPVIYDKYGNEPVFDEFEEFWKQVEKGEVTAGSEKDRIEHSIADDLKKEEETNLVSSGEEKSANREESNVGAYSQRATISQPEEKKSFFSKAKSFFDFKK
jgi:hypothetical protein